MRDITLEEIIDEVQKSFRIPVPRFVIKYICNYAINKMIKVMKDGKNRVQLYHCDIQYVYPDIDEEKLCMEFADIDETKELNWHDVRSIDKSFVSV